MEKTISSKQIFDGKIVKLSVDDVILENGNPAKRELVTHPGGACIALKNNEDKFFIVNQYRYAQKIDMLEFPAGKLEPNENPLEAIKREVVEETGYSAKNINYLGPLVVSGGYLTEVDHLYYGEIDQYLGQNLDPEEDLSIELYSLDEIIDMIMNNKIIDAKTIALAFKVKKLLNK